MDLKKITGQIFITSFLLNLFWEISHSALYNWDVIPLRNDIIFYVTSILRSTFFDALAIIIIFGVISLFVKNIKWISKPSRNHQIAIIGLGLIYAILIELKAIVLNTWTYSSYMPTILGIGLTPLIQISVTGILTLKIIEKLLKK